MAEFARETQQAAGMEDGLGLQVEFESFPDIELAFESLARERSGIELLNVRHEDNRTHATVFVPDGKLDHFERLVRDYLAETRDKDGPSPRSPAPDRRNPTDSRGEFAGDLDRCGRCDPHDGRRCGLVGNLVAVRRDRSATVAVFPKPKAWRWVMVS